MLPPKKFNEINKYDANYVTRIITVIYICGEIPREMVMNDTIELNHA